MLAQKAMIIKPVSCWNTVSVIALSICVFLFRYFRRAPIPIEQNSVTLITGGGSGIGLALAVEFSKAKNRIVLIGRNETALRRAADECSKAGALEVQILVADLMTAEGTSYVVKRVEELYPKQLHYLVLNAGSGAILPFSREPKFEQVCRDLIEINYLANVRLLQGFLGTLEHTNSRSSPSRVIAISSLAGVLPSILRTPYTASKHAFQGFMNALRGETAVSITLCCPGYVDTDFHARASLPSLQGDNVNEEAENKGQAQYSQRRGIPPSKCAQLCLDGATRGEPELIMSVSGKLGYTLRPIFTRLIDHFAKKKSLDSLKH